MKKIINSYRTFAPDLYTIFGTIVGSILLCLLAAFIYRVALPEFTIISIPVMLIMLDVMGDFFVFEGIFSKNFDFGLLTTSLKGFSVLKMAVIGDQLRRFLQITAVMTVCGIIVKPALFEKNFFTGNLTYAGFLIVLILTIYCANTLVLNVTRHFSNYAEGILPMTFLSLVESVAIFMIETLFVQEGSADPMPLIIVMTILSIAVTFIMCERIKKRYMDSFRDTNAKEA